MTNQKSTEITVDQDFYDKFNEVILSSQGVPFDELAADRPADAYKLLTHVVEGVAGTADIITTTKDMKEGMKVSKEMDGEAAMSGFARHAIREVTQDTDIQPIDVVVSVFQKPKFRDAIRGRKTEPKQVVAFRVEPPNLAF